MNLINDISIMNTAKFAIQIGRSPPEFPRLAALTAKFRRGFLQAPDNGLRVGGGRWMDDRKFHTDEDSAADAKNGTKGSTGPDPMLPRRDKGGESATPGIAHRHGRRSEGGLPGGMAGGNSGAASAPWL